MTTSHTPGPWLHWQQLCGEPAGIITQDKTGTHIAIPTAFSAYPEISLANARLIAAAPDLLEVAQVIAADSRWTSGEPLLMQVRAAIAKATGAA